MSDYLDWSDNAFNGLNGGADLSAAVSSNWDASAFAGSYSAPTASGFGWSDVTNTIDYGLKTAGTVFGAYTQAKSMELQNYLLKGNMDLARTQIGSQSEVARVNAEANKQVAMIRSNAATTGASLASFGQNNNSFMLILTILGVLFAGVQIFRGK